MLIIEKVLLLRNSNIFHNCREMDLVDIASICEEEYIDKNTTIFQKGEQGNCMYFIYSVSLSISLCNHLWLIAYKFCQTKTKSSYLVSQVKHIYRSINLGKVRITYHLTIPTFCRNINTCF